MKIKDFLISSNCLHSPAGYNSIWSAIIRKKKKIKEKEERRMKQSVLIISRPHSLFCSFYN